MIRKLILSLLLLFFYNGFSQKSANYNPNYADYKTALQLFKDRQYQSAQIIFGKIITESSDVSQTEKEDSNYYYAVCAFHLNQENSQIAHLIATLKTIY